MKKRFYAFLSMLLAFLLVFNFSAVFALEEPTGAPTQTIRTQNKPIDIESIPVSELTGVAPPPPPAYIGDLPTGDGESFLPPSETVPLNPDYKPEEEKTGAFEAVFDEFGKMADKAEDEKPSPIPDDAWDGDFASFPGKDGSVTKVYDNGSVVTDYPDGTRTAVDYKGNRYEEDKNGVQTAYLNDGVVAMSHPDGTVEYKDSEGFYQKDNPDGTFITQNPAGLCFEHGADGDLKSIYFEGGGKLNMTEEGYLPEGEYTITGPNGGKFTLVNTTYDDLTTKDFSFIIEGNGQSAYGKSSFDEDGNGFVDYKKFDGSGGKAEYTDDIITSFDINCKSGGNMNGHYTENGFTIDVRDENGNQSNFMNANVDQNGITTVNVGDGSMVIKVDPNNETFELRTDDGFYVSSDEKNGNTTMINPNTGDIVVVENGEVKDLHITYDDGSVLQKNGDTYQMIDGKTGEVTTATADSDGNVTVNMPNGSVMNVGNNGNINITSPDGSTLNYDAETGTYTSYDSETGETTTSYKDENGNIKIDTPNGTYTAKDGKFYDEDGNEVPKTYVFSGKSDDENKDTDGEDDGGYGEPDEGDYEGGDYEEEQPPVTYNNPTTAELEGVYSGTLTVTSFNMDPAVRAALEEEGCDFSEAVGQANPTNITITRVDDYSVIVRLSDEDDIAPTPATYDPSTGTLVMNYYDSESGAGGNMTLQCSYSGSGISLSGGFNVDYPSEYGNVGIAIAVAGSK